MGWLLFALGVVSLVLALNALRPSYWWPLRGISFMAQLLVAEAAPWAIVLLAMLSAVLARGGALEQWQGLAGLGLTVLAIAILAWEVNIAYGTSKGMIAALASGGLEPPGTHLGRWRRAAFPFWLNASGVERIANLRYAEGGGSRHLLDVYRPRGGVKGAPVLLQIHGGAWVFGSKRNQGRPLMNRMVADGWVCVAINYRLTPAVKFPGHLVDCKLALAWIREHIAEYGGDPTRVAVTGGSAGGHLAAMVALTQNAPEYQPGFEAVDTSVMACVPVYGPFDLELVFAKTHPRVAAWFKHAVFGKDVLKASPISHVRSGLPPMLVIQGGADNLVPRLVAHNFVAAMRAAGNKTVLHFEVPGAGHAFDVFHSFRSEAVVAGIHRFLDNVAGPSRERDGRV